MAPPRRVHTAPERSYRRRLRPGPNETSFQVVVEQTDLHVTAEQHLAEPILEHLRALRAQLKTHMALQPEFAAALTPVAVPKDAPEIVKSMAEAARIAGVGPMAAVAGALAQNTADAFQQRSPNILVENGGDLFLHSTRDRAVGLLANPVDGVRLGLHFPADRFPLAVCASSGTIGHSLSLGDADLVTVVARTGALADAAATALANMIASADDLEPMLNQAKSLAKHGLIGVFAQYEDRLAVWGGLELVAVA